MGRLADKLARATNAVAGVEEAVERDIDKLIQRTEVVHAKREAAFVKKHEQLDRHMTDLSEFETALDDFGKNEPSGGGTHSADAYESTRVKS